MNKELELPIFWNLAHKNNPYQQKRVVFQKSKKRAKSLHPNVHEATCKVKQVLKQFFCTCEVDLIKIGPLFSFSLKRKKKENNSERDCV